MKKSWILTLILLALAGTLQARTVKASSFGFDAKDATVCLKRAIASGAEKVIIDNVGKEWLSGPLVLRSNLELVLEKGVTLRAKSELFKERVIYFIAVRDVENVTIRGEKGAKICMNKADFMDMSKYVQSEWRHAVSINGAHNVTVCDLTIDGSGGNGIAINSSHKRHVNTNITIKNIVSINHHRLAIGIGSVDGLLIENCTGIATVGTPPQAGIDFEPNWPDEKFSNIVVRNCVFTGNAAMGFMFVLGNLNATTPPISALVENCRIVGNKHGGLRFNGSTVKGNVLFKNCYFDAETGNGFYFCNFSDGALKLKFQDCVLDASKSPHAPIMISSIAQEDFGGIDLGNLVVKMPLKRELIDVSGLGVAGMAKSFTGKPVIRWKGKERAVNVAKYVAANKRNTALSAFKTKVFQTKNYRAPEKGKVVKVPPVKLRGRNNRFSQWVKAGQTVKIKFQMIKSSKYELKGEVEVQDDNGGFMNRFKLDEKEKVYTFRAAGDTAITFVVNVGPNSVIITSDTPGHGYPADRPVRICTGNNDFYFLVTPEQTEVTLEIYGEEPVRGILYNAAGKVVAEHPKRFIGTKLLTAKRKPSPKAELWRVKLTQVMEDHSIRVGAPSEPILFSAPGHAVMIKK